MKKYFHLRSREQLKHEYAEGPVIGADVVSLVEDDLGSNVLGSSAESPRLPANLELLGKAKVDLEINNCYKFDNPQKIYCSTHELDVSGSVEEKILWLQVSVDDSPGVEVIERLNNARSVKPGRGVVKVSSIPQDSPKLSAETGIHEHVKVLPVLERLEEPHDELAVGLLHDLLLRHDVLLLAGLHNLKKIHYYLVY